MQPKVIICVPTFREPQKVLKFLRSLAHVQHRPLELIVVNANPGDETSRLIAQVASTVDFLVREEHGCADQYWSGTINRGLRLIVEEASDDDWVLLANVDIAFHTDLVAGLLRKALELAPCQIGALSHANGRVISSGVQVRSWALGLNRHPLAGFLIEEVPEDFCISVDLLPTRCMLFPAEALRKAGLMAEHLLPHYGADNEFSRRLSRLGYQPHLCGTVRVESDTENSGKCIFSRRTTFRERLADLMSIKNPSNLRYRTNFIRLTYPAYAVPTAVAIYLVRTFFEVCFGGDLLMSLVTGREHGFSK